MSSNISSEILKTIRSRKGCSLHDLFRSLPEAYDHSDCPPGFFLNEPLRKLFDWGLIQAYRGTDLVVTTNKNDSIGELRDCTFYISPLAASLEAELGFSLSGASASIFGEPFPKQGTRWPEVFVLMPFAVELRPIYDDHIKLVTNNAGFSIARADDFFGTRSVVHEIWSAINHASLVLADCTGRNPNVFYEIGIAHAIGKETILISQSIEDVPFDLRHLRVIVYEFTPRGMSDFETKLSKTLGSKSLMNTPASKRTSLAEAPPGVPPNSRSPIRKTKRRPE